MSLQSFGGFPSLKIVVHVWDLMKGQGTVYVCVCGRPCGPLWLVYTETHAGPEQVAPIPLLGLASSPGARLRIWAQISFALGTHQTYLC